MTKVWVFDLDDTLHNASAHIFPVMNRAMTQYIMNELHLDEDEAHQLRQHYWRVYGATLKGLIRHHDVDPHHFLQETHAFSNLQELVLSVKRLKYFLDRIKARKCVFTNAPKAYAIRVLQILGIDQCFELIFSVESTKFHAKPSTRGFQMLLKALRVKPSDCIMLEDNVFALQTAKRLGMRTILVTKRLRKPNYVDCRVNSVLALTHVRV